MDSFFIDVDYSQIYKDGEKIGGDVFLLSREKEKGKIVATLSDGLGSGVKANVLASLTAHMAHKLSFSPINLKHSAEIIMNTLPVCRDRKISYSTFTVAELDSTTDDGYVSLVLIEYDNPLSLRFFGSSRVRWEREDMQLTREAAFKKEIVKFSSFHLGVGERLVMFSDGVTQSGLGKGYRMGWGRENVSSFISGIIEKDPDISSRDLSRAIVEEAQGIDGGKSKDDITCSVIYVRHPRACLVVTGPPVKMESDDLLKDKISAFDGRKIISGGTTAQIVSRLFGKKLKVDLTCWSRSVPPASIMEGFDLVTEGVLTMNKVTEVLESRVPISELPNDPVRKYVSILLDSDHIHFIVGMKINEAQQDPGIPPEIGIRRSVVSRLANVLEEVYLKETTVEYL